MLLKPKAKIYSLFGIALSFVISCFGLVLNLSPWGASLDRVYYDSLFLLRGARDSGHEIVIVAIDEMSFDELDLRWPWPRSIHARLLNSLKLAGAKVVGFDLLFSEPSEENQDYQFAKSIENFKDVVLVNEMSQVEDPNRGFFMNKIVNPNPIIDKASVQPRLGLANMIFDPDGFVRSLNLQREGEKSFSSQVVSLYLGKDLQTSEERADINFIGQSRTVDTISYYQALEPDTYLPKNFLKDKIVLVGFAVASKAELDNSPVDHYPIPYSKWKGGVMSGVEIHSHVIDNLLNNNFIRRANKITLIWIGFLLGVVGGAILFYVRPVYGALIFLFVLISLISSSFLSFIYLHQFYSIIFLLLPFLLCCIVSPIFHYLKVRKERAFIRKAFSQYLSPKLVEELIKNPDKLELGGEEREGTVMFLDIAGFTSLSESLTAKELITFVNLYLGSFAEKIISVDGMIDKYIGDCIMAVWGIPIFDPEHGVKAAKVALELKLILLELNKTSDKLGEISFRAGITSGQMLAGNVGGGMQFNYTVLGNEVNLASRLENLNKYYGTTVIVSERTKKLLDPKFVLRELDEVQVKGQKKNEVLFELCGFASCLSDEYLEGLSNFKKGRDLYLLRDWENAIKSFESVLMVIPRDVATKLYINRCKEFIQNPPADNWTGVHVMLEK